MPRTKVNTARLRPGVNILITRTLTEGVADVAFRITGAHVARVLKVTPYRAGRKLRYNVETSAGVIKNMAGVQTYMIADPNLDGAAWRGERCDSPPVGSSIGNCAQPATVEIKRTFDRDNTPDAQWVSNHCEMHAAGIRDSEAFDSETPINV